MTTHPRPSPPRSHRPRRLGASLAFTLGAATAFTATTHAQTQSLAFTGGVLLNPRVTFRNLGFVASTANAGPASGAAANRTYDDGFNRVDASGNKEGATANWGYQRPDQIAGGFLVLTTTGPAGTVTAHDTADFLEPSGNLEYRGSLGSVGDSDSDWGILLGVGYQTVHGRTSDTFTTDYTLLHDRFDLGGLTAKDLPGAPYAGSANLKEPRIASTPSRSFESVAGGRRLTGTWDIDAELVPITVGVYLETQIAGRLNGVISAGVLAMLVNADLSIYEQSTVAGSAPKITAASQGTNDFVVGGFVQGGLDWALWEKTSLVASARWQPTETFSHSVNGREAEIDFAAAFAVHAGFSIRF